MEFIDHFEGSLYRIRQKDPKFLIDHREVLCRLLAELHIWFDEFSETKGEDYDFTGRKKIRHRARRHHQEGLIEIVEKLVLKYGEEYRQIIEQEARQHIIDDMGRMLFADDYLEPGFWTRYSG